MAKPVVKVLSIEMSKIGRFAGGNVSSSVVLAQFFLLYSCPSCLSARITTDSLSPTIYLSFLVVFCFVFGDGQKKVVIIAFFRVARFSGTRKKNSETR
jgi:hypothetical protein